MMTPPANRLFPSYFYGQPTFLRKLKKTRGNPYVKLFNKNSIMSDKLEQNVDNGHFWIDSNFRAAIN